MTGLRVVVAPGDGVVARFGDVVLVVPSPAPAGVVERLVDACRSAGGGGGVGRLAALAGDVGGFCAAELDDGGGLEVVVHGRAEAVVDDGRSRAPVRGTAMVPAGFAGVVLAAPGARLPAPGPVGDLREGIVAGAGATIVGTGPAAGAPLVTGVLCSRNHFNHPRALYCGVCGIGMVQLTTTPVQGPRPSLGSLVLDDGSSYPLDRDYVLGRSPAGDPAVVEGRALPLVVSDSSHAISRVHARVELVDWDVRLVDLHSANGTWVWSPGDSGWTRLTPGRPVDASPGTHVLLGRRTFVVQPANRR